MKNWTRIGVLAIIFLVTVAVTWAITVVPEDLSAGEVNADAGLISSWPSGPLLGVPPLALGAEVDVDECVSLAENEVLDLVPHDEPSAVWVFTEADSVIRLSWNTTQLEQSIFIPEEHIANESSQGRVTVNLSARVDDARASIAASKGEARVCGLQSTAGPDGGPLAENALFTTWPTGPLSDVAPILIDSMLDAESCVAVTESGTVTMIPDSAAETTFWAYADTGTRVLLQWETMDGIEQSMYIPERQLANEAQAGRVTVTLTPHPASQLTVTAARGDVRLCGLE